MYFKKINEVKKVADGFNKDAKGYNYTYVSGNQILAKIKDKMQEIGLLLMPGVSTIDNYSKHEYDKTDKYGKVKHVIEFIVSGKMSYTWINCDNPEDKYTVEWVFFGQQDDISKVFWLWIDLFRKILSFKSLGLPTDDDDPDGKPKIDYADKKLNTSKENIVKDKPKEQEKKIEANGRVLEILNCELDNQSKLAYLIKERFIAQEKVLKALNGEKANNIPGKRYL